MAEDRQKKNKRDDLWARENTTRINIKLFHNTDQDILTAIENAPAKATELKRLIRVGIAAEKETL